MVETKDQQKEKYKKIKKLSTGESGDFFLVNSKLTGKLWVIKKVDLKDLTYDERVKARDEAIIMEVLNHPNIILSKEVFKNRDLKLNIVMEYADGGELSDLIKQKKRAG